MSKKCKAYSRSGLGLGLPDSRKAFYAGWDAALAEQPAQQEPVAWIGLTDEERRSIREWQRIQEELGPVWAPMMLYLYEAIEAKLKEKNT